MNNGEGVVIVPQTRSRLSPIHNQQGVYLYNMK